MKRVLLISFFNSGNIGDRAICRVLKEKMETIAEVETMDITGKAVQSADIVTREKKTCKKCRFFALKSIVALRKPKRFDHAERCIKHCDVIVIAGGSMVMEQELFSVYSFFADKYTKLAKKHRKKVAILFVGVGRNKTAVQRRRWHSVLQKAELLSVRDSLSKKKMCEELGVTRDIFVWKDPVFWLDSRKESVPQGAIAINIYLDAAGAGVEKERLKQLYLYLITELSKENRVVLYSTERNDNEGMHEVYDAIEEKGRVSICTPSNIEDLLQLYQAVDAAVTTRMHAFIIATTQMVPSIALSWNDKIDGVAEDIGMSDFVVNIHSAPDRKDDILKQLRSFVREPGQHIRFLCDIDRKNHEQLENSLNVIRAFMGG